MMKQPNRYESPPQVPDELALWSIKEVKEVLHYKSDNSIYDLMRTKHFPKPIKLNPKKSLWRKKDVLAWIERLETA